MTVYSMPDCPQCKFLMDRMAENHMTYEYNMNAEEMTKLGISSVPVLRTDDGKMLGFREALAYVMAYKEGSA